MEDVVGDGSLARRRELVLRDAHRYTRERHHHAVLEARRSRGCDLDDQAHRDVGHVGVRFRDRPTNTAQRQQLVGRRREQRHEASASAIATTSSLARIPARRRRTSKRGRLGAKLMDGEPLRARDRHDRQRAGLPRVAGVYPIARGATGFHRRRIFDEPAYYLATIRYRRRDPSRGRLTLRALRGNAYARATLGRRSARLRAHAAALVLARARAARRRGGARQPNRTTARARRVARSILAASLNAISRT